MILGTVASARTETSLLSETFTGTDGAAWNSDRWPFVRDGTTQISSNKGSQSNGSPANALTDQVVTDCEILVKATFAASMGFPEIGWRINNGIASGTPSSGYVVQFGGSVQIFKIDGYGGVGSSVSGAGLAGTTQWVKVRVVGSSLKVRWWTDGAAEPSTWQIEATDSTYSRGVLALRQWGSNTVLWDDYSVTDLASPATGPNGSFTRLEAGDARRDPFGLTGSNVSFCCWFHEFENFGGGYTREFLGISDGSNYLIARVGSSNNIELIGNVGGNTATAQAVAEGSWYFVGVVRTASGCDIYTAPSGATTCTKVSGTTTGTITSGRFFIGDQMWGHIAAVKVWQAALTQAEIEAEMATYAAVRTANLYAAYPFDDGLSATDASGNSRTLTLTGGIASGPAPPGVS